MDPNRLPDPFDCLGMLRRAGWSVGLACFGDTWQAEASRPGEVTFGRGATDRAAVGDLLLELGLWPEEDR